MVFFGEMGKKINFFRYSHICLGPGENVQIYERLFLLFSLSNTVLCFLGEQKKTDRKRVVKQLVLRGGHHRWKMPGHGRVTHRICKGNPFPQRKSYSLSSKLVDPLFVWSVAVSLKHATYVD